jgi:peptidylprolyl isomerase
LQAAASKEAGNAAFKAKDFSGAKKAYDKALDFLENINDETLEQAEQMQAIKVGSLLNGALMLQKLGEWGEAIEPCNKALKLDEGNTKALFRRGVAEMNFGLLEESKATLVLAAKGDPKNKDIRTALAATKDAIKAEKAKAKGTFGGMFDKMGSMYVDKPTVVHVEAWKGPLPQVFMDLVPMLSPHAKSPC